MLKLSKYWIAVCFKNLGYGLLQLSKCKILEWSCSVIFLCEDL